MAEPVVVGMSELSPERARRRSLLKESIGIEHGLITTIHDITNTQVPIDSFKSDLRRARSGLTSLIPTTTG